MKLFKNFMILDVIFFFVLLFSYFDIDQSNYADWLIFYGVVAVLLFAVKWGWIFGQRVTGHLLVKFILWLLNRRAV